jgi:hypothetical protein
LLLQQRIDAAIDPCRGLARVARAHVAQLVVEERFERAMVRGNGLGRVLQDRLEPR